MSTDKRTRATRPGSAPEPDSSKPQAPARPVRFPPERPEVPADAPPAQVKNAEAKDTQAKNEGEGNRSADRQYREGATAFAKSGRVERAAEAAADAVDGSEGKALSDAEKRARSGR